MLSLSRGSEAEAALTRTKFFLGGKLLAERSEASRCAQSSRRVRKRSRPTLVYLISGLGTGDGISWRDAMRAAGSLFTSAGISILLEVIVTPLVRLLCRLGWLFSKLLICDQDFGILPGFIARCQPRFTLIGPAERAVLLKIKFTHLHKRSRPCVLRRRNASHPTHLTLRFQRSRPAAHGASPAAHRFTHGNTLIKEGSSIHRAGDYQPSRDLIFMLIEEWGGELWKDTGDTLLTEWGFFF